MIHHLSISAENPQHTAQVLAEILHGKSAPDPFNPDGCYIAIPFDEHGTAIEVYPLGTEVTLSSQDEKQVHRENPAASGFTATHVMISVPATIEQIEQIAHRENWLIQRANSGFDYILFWVENRQLLELLTPEMAVQYKAVAHPDNLRNLFVFSEQQD